MMLIECRLAFFRLCDPSTERSTTDATTLTSTALTLPALGTITLPTSGTFTSPESGPSSLPARGTDKGSRPSTPTAQSPFGPAKLTIFPELDLTVEIEDRRNPEKPTKFRIAGRADWALAYGDRKGFCCGNTLIAVVKTPEMLSGAQSQLLTYLAILQRIRRQHDKIDHCVQGFFSDGITYGFMAINNEGMVVSSKSYNIKSGKDLRTVFNWIVSLMVTSVKSSPSTSPTKPGSTRDEEINNSMEKVFVKFYRREDLCEDESTLGADARFGNGMEKNDGVVDEDMFVDVSDPSIEVAELESTDCQFELW